MLGIVGELFVVKKKLFACSEDELGAAINALQNSIGELHGRLPQEREISQKSAMYQPTCRSVSLSSYSLAQQGPGPQTCRGKKLFQFAGRYESAIMIRLSWHDRNYFCRDGPLVELNKRPSRAFVPNQRPSQKFAKK
jgi:hypothetical protein